MKKIYISPSDQSTNMYADGIHNEKQVMDIVARLLFDKLSLYDVLPILNPSKGIQERLNEANAMKVDYYLILHTNAFNRSEGRGCETYFQDGSDNPPLRNQLSREFATNVNNEISAITTSNTLVGDRGTKHAHLLNGQDRLWELRDINTPASYCEAEFHDTAIGCSWILSNEEQLSDAYCRAVVKTMGLTLKYVEPTPVTPSFGVGSKVKIKQSATNYSTGQPIPDWVKANTYTIQQIAPSKILLAEIMSWVNSGDIEGYVAPAPTPIPTPVAKPWDIGYAVRINSTAAKYVTGQPIPNVYKGARQYTIQELYPKANPNRALLKEIMSWVYLKDLNKV